MRPPAEPSLRLGHLRAEHTVEATSLKPGAQHQVYWITRRIAQGQFVTRKRAAYLCSIGITHVLNVSDTPSIILAEEYGFRSVRDYPVADLQIIPESDALACLNALHEMLSEHGSKVYVHCVAGQNRSPTILWLYFVACGMSPSAAKQIIEARTLDAVPGHAKMVDDRLIAAVVAHGQDHFLPLGDADILAPVS